MASGGKTAAVICAGALSAIAGQAVAQESEAASMPAPDDIVVTATRFDTRLVDAPLAATVLTEEFIRDARIQSLRQIDDYVPNVQFNQIGQVGGTYVTIRGIESNPFIINRAAVYIDGIPFREPSDQALGFAEQVEVLRGPQGTLYGANTESGLILIRTRMPTEWTEVEATASGYAFGGGEGWQGRFVLCGPVIPGKLAAMLVATHESTDSYVRNLASSIGEQGSIRKSFVQGKLRWTPDHRMTVDMIGYISLMRAPGLYEQEFLPMDRARYDNLYSAAFNGGRRSGRYTIFHDAPKRSREDEYTLAANATYRFDWANFDTNLSWRKVKDHAVGTDLDLTALSAVAGGHRDTEEHWNLEMRLSAASGAPVQWVAGFNHYRDRRQKSLSTLAGPGGVDDYDLAPPQTKWSRDYAGFAQASVPVTPGVRLTGGLRYERAERSKRQTEGTLDLGPIGQFFFPEEDLRGAFEAVLPRVSVDWKPTANWTLYASAAKGWIPGGFNLAAGSGSTAEDFSRYGSERLWTYEAGAKATLGGGKLLLGAALFHTDADNWQEFNVLYNPDGTVASTTLITSTASIRSRGFELELSGRPTPQLDLAASLGVVDAEYRDYRFGETTNFAGNRVKLVPRWDASISASWRPWKGLFLRSEANGTGASTLRADGAARQGSYWLLNAQAGWETANWSIRLYVNNLTDKRAFTTSAYTNSLLGNDGIYYAGVGAPRVVGMELGSKW